MTDIARLRAMLKSGSPWDHDDKSGILDEIERLRATIERIKDAAVRRYDYTPTGAATAYDPTQDFVDEGKPF